MENERKTEALALLRAQWHEGMDLHTEATVRIKLTQNIDVLLDTLADREAFGDVLKAIEQTRDELV